MKRRKRGETADKYERFPRSTNNVCAFEVTGRDLYEHLRQPVADIQVDAGELGAVLPVRLPLVPLI
jgi:hypothetical protein